MHFAHKTVLRGVKQQGSYAPQPDPFRRELTMIRNWNFNSVIDRRTFLQTTAALSSMAVMPRILGFGPAAAQAASTLVIAAPATPQSLDCEFDVSLGTF